MDIVIIEDETRTAKDIAATLSAIRPSYRVRSILDSIEQALDWFQTNTAPDLVISDIQLGDGLAFSIFRQVELKCPIIFCTAYNEYALQAFETNGIDYILKPVNDTALEKSLAKVEGMLNSLSPRYDIGHLESLIREMYNRNARFKTSFLVSFRNQLIPIQTDDIAFFKIESDSTVLYTRNGTGYAIAKTLESLEMQLDPVSFRRANRQYIVSFSGIGQVEYYDERKLLVRLRGFPKEEVIVSKQKATEFIRWMEER